MHSATPSGVIRGGRRSAVLRRVSQGLSLGALLPSIVSLFGTSLTRVAFADALDEVASRERLLREIAAGWTPARAGPVHLNTLWLEQRWATTSGGGRATGAPPGVTIVSSDPASRACFETPRSVLEHVLLHTPEGAAVYPSEQYFYFRFLLGDAVVSGNIRFTDAAEGVLHVGYFLADDPRVQRYRALRAEDGVVVTPHGDGAYSVEAAGIRRSFALHERPFERAPTPQPIDENLAHVSGILDESGYALDLMFDHDWNAFFFQLQHHAPLPEALRLLDPAEFDGAQRSILQRMQPLRLLVGVESGFAYVLSPDDGRLVLVGVEAGNVAANNEFDGPFDQVPPRLPLRAKIHLAYPYTKLGAGIDEHGVFRGVRGARVAISPYHDYDDLGDLLDHLSRTVDPSRHGTDRFVRATLEDKRNFHPQLVTPAFGRGAGFEHRRDVSLTWAADHWPTVSRREAASEAHHSLRDPAETAHPD